MAASIGAVAAQVNQIAKGAGYRCEPISWEDAQRGYDGTTGALSCWGENISDVRLYEREDSRLLYTLRSENWNERVGLVNPADVNVIVGNEVAGGSPPRPTALSEYLSNVGQFANCAGVHSDISSLLVPPPAAGGNWQPGVPNRSGIANSEGRLP